MTRPHNITDVVKIVYCEQKFVYDRMYGERRSPITERLRIEGIKAHSQLEKDGYKELYRTPATLLAHLQSPKHHVPVPDKRCFIANHLYGGDAWQAVLLRQWRDRTLMKSRVGRLVVSTYYVISPSVVLLLARYPLLSQALKYVLDAVVMAILSKETPSDGRN